MLKLLRLQPRNLGAELVILVRRLRNEGSKLSSCSADWDVAGALVQYCDNRSSCNGGSISGWGGLLAQEEARRATEAHTHAHTSTTTTTARASVDLSYSPSLPLSLASQALLACAAIWRTASSTRRMSTRLQFQTCCSCGAQRREWADTPRAPVAHRCHPHRHNNHRRRPPRHIISVFNTLQSRPVHERLSRSNVDLQVVILAHWIESRVRVEMRHHLTHAHSLACSRQRALTHNIVVVSVVAATPTQV